ncbi:MAG: hypothetical protein DRO99_02450 [Candidatus Aenigmatarchaeota archaeon]|nr:MAG: hypothetical protein DRO99_02450 [Candidatus Aenigmarchaeota archaeon]
MTEEETKGIDAKPAEEEQQETQEEKAEGAEDEVSEEEEAKMKLPFPTAAVVRIMKAHMDDEKMIKKDVKVAMNKWLGEMCAQVSNEMNKFPYVMMHMNEFKEAKRVYEDLENFQKEKERILAHLDAIKKDIERLERDLGKEEGEVIIVKKKEDAQ